MPLTRTHPTETILCRHPEEKIELIEAMTLYTEGLDEFTDFGTHVLHWELQKQDLTEERLPIISLFRRILELTDSISTLLKSRVVDPCEILLRSLLETTLSLEYILKTESDRRALSYLFVEYAERLTYLKRHRPKDSNYKQYQKEYKRGQAFKDVPKLINLKENIAHIQEWMDRLEHAEIKTEYRRVKEAKAKEWFSLFSDSFNEDEAGEKRLLFTVKDLAKHLYKFDFYEILYKEWSKSVHGTDTIKGNFLGKDKAVYMVSLRQPVNAHGIANLTIRLLESVMQSIYMFNVRQKNEQYQDMLGRIAWWSKAYHINYTNPIIERDIQFEAM